MGKNFLGNQLEVSFKSRGKLFIELTLIFLFFVLGNFDADAAVGDISVVEFFDGEAGVFLDGHFCEAEAF